LIKHYENFYFIISNYKAMKKIITLVYLMLGIVYATLAQESKYQTTMKKAVLMLDTTIQTTSYETMKNVFERIALAEKKEWLPYYYAAYCAMRVTYREKDINKLDMKADIAQAFLDKADSLCPKQSEIYCVKAMVLLSRIEVDFMSRGPKYSIMGDGMLKEAIALDPTNPRPYLIIGDGKFSIPEQFGGDKKMACQLFDKADTMFNNKVKDDFSPRWGRKTLDRLLKLCEASKPVSNVKPQQP
jgi:hypothetical protein